MLLKNVMINDTMIFVTGEFIFNKKVGDNEPSSYSWNIEVLKGNPASAMFAAIREVNVNTNNPMLSVSDVACDKLDHSEFPSSHGERRDVLLLYVAFDEKSHARHFWALSRRHVADSVRGSDEAGFFHTKELTRGDERGARSTRGSDDDYCKNALISSVFRRIKQL